MEVSPLTEEYLIEVQERCNAATSGPWISYIEGRTNHVVKVLLFEGQMDVKMIYTWLAAQYPI